MKTLTIIAALLLSSCAGFDKDGNPNPIWVSENLCIGMMCPGSGGKTGYAEPAFNVGGINDWKQSSGMAAHQANFEPIRRNDPNEKPRVVKHEVAPGKVVDVLVYDEACIGGDGSANAVVGVYSVFLCGRRHPHILKHELAHHAGLEHGPWLQGGGGKCAKVKRAGHNTDYTVGTMICVANDHEWKEAAK